MPKSISAKAGLIRQAVSSPRTGSLEGVDIAELRPPVRPIARLLRIIDHHPIPQTLTFLDECVMVGVDLVGIVIFDRIEAQAEVVAERMVGHRAKNYK